MNDPALFLDRDGTINYDIGYISAPDKVKLYPGVAQGIKELRKSFGFKMIVISNQSGIARGLMTHEDVEAVNSKINTLLAEQGTLIDAFYYCPFHPEFGNESSSNCRKPSPELVFRTEKDYGIDLKRSYFIGDKVSDVECGFNVGLKTIFLKNEINADEIIRLKKEGKRPNFVADNFLMACEFIKKDFTEAVS